MKKFEEVMSVSNEIENITAEEAKKKLNDPNVQFIDVRDKESFSKGTIGNAIHLDRGLLEFYLAEGSPIENDTFKNNPFNNADPNGGYRATSNIPTVAEIGRTHCNFDSLKNPVVICSSRWGTGTNDYELTNISDPF